MKTGWRTSTLGELCDVLDHKRKPITKRDRIAGEYPYYGATGVLGHVEGYIFDEPLVLVGEDGAKWESGENTAFAVEGKIWVNNHAHVLRPHRTNLLDNWLIYHLNHSDLTEFVSGLTVPKLNQGNLREIPIPVPPLPEQRRIVGILDEAFAGIATAKANAEKNLQNARALFESHLRSVFAHRGPDWVDRPLERVARIVNGYAFKSTDFSPRKGVKCIKITNVGVRLFVPNSEDFLPLGFEVTYAPVAITKGSIVIALTRTIISGGLKVAIVPEDYDGALLNQRVASIIPDPRLLTQAFLFAFLSTSAVVDYVKERVNTLMQPNLSVTALRNMPIPLVPLDQQMRVAGTISDLREETQRLAALCERKLAALDELKKSLLHQAFNGQL